MGRLAEKVRKLEERAEIENYALLRVHVEPFIRIACLDRTRLGDYVYEFRATDGQKVWKAQVNINPEMFLEPWVIQRVGEEINFDFKRKLADAYGKIHVSI